MDEKADGCPGLQPISMTNIWLPCFSRDGWMVGGRDGGMDKWMDTASYTDGVL